MIENKTKAAPRGSIGNPCETLGEVTSISGKYPNEMIWVKAGTLLPEKPKRLRRKNVTAKYLKEQEPAMWDIMYGSTVLELEMQKAIINSNKKNPSQYVGHLPKLFIENIAHNVACKAVHEHLKRTRI